MRPRVKVWLLLSGRVKLGDGRARLLQLVDELGSLRRAVGHMKMSYRHGWGAVRELERAAGTKLVEQVPGAGPRGGSRLTPAARRLLARYRAFQADVERDAERIFRRRFPQRG